MSFKYSKNILMTYVTYLKAAKIQVKSDFQTIENIHWIEFK